MKTRALVLGGGGITGVAWELGMLAGLAEQALDLTVADLIVGTSAGSVVGADITSGRPLDELYRSQLAEASSEIGAKMSPLLLARWMMAMIPRDVTRSRVRLGRLAARARTVSEAERRAVIEARLPVREWPDARDLRVTAVDIQSGGTRVFDSASGVALVDAVGASCAVPGIWPPVTIGGRRYMDGGMRTVANADLAAGSGRVVILAPITRGFGRSASPARQASELRGAGAQVTLIAPDPAALRAFGRNVLDPARRAPAARAGYRQASDVAERVRAAWTDEAGTTGEADPAAASA